MGAEARYRRCQWRRNSDWRYIIGRVDGGFAHSHMPRFPKLAGIDMAVFLSSLLVFSLVIAAMAVGVMAGRTPIKGSCGGLGKLGVAGACEICGGDTQRCEQQAEKAEARVINPLTGRSTDQ